MISSNSKSRSGSSLPSPKSSSPKPTKATPSSPDSSNSMDRKPWTKLSSISVKRMERVTEMKQQLSQLQEELKKAKEDRSKALKELEEVKKKAPSQSDYVPSDRVKMLELEAEKAKDSERKMLESMVAQTKQLEQTKISLEEAKLGIRTLHETIRNLERSGNRSSRNLGERAEKSSGSSDTARTQEEIAALRNELRLAVGAEEKAKKAMDDLAIALKEVTEEANRAKSELAEAQSELENARAEAERSKPLLKSTEERLRVAVEESERLRSELEESAAAWNAKENGFIDCVKVSEELIMKTKQENDKLIDSQRATREENYNLRDILKQAVNEATIAKETLEIARNENSLLKDSLTENEKALQGIKQDFYSLKVSEAAAVDSLNELKGMLAGGSIMDLSKNGISSENGSFRQSKTNVNEAAGNKKITKSPSDHWRGDNPRIQNRRRHSVSESGKSKGSGFDTTASPERERDRMFASVSNISDRRGPSSIVMDDGETLNSDDFDHIDGMQLESIYDETKQQKKKTMLRRFGNMLRRKSYHK